MKLSKSRISLLVLLVSSCLTDRIDNRSISYELEARVGKELQIPSNIASADSIRYKIVSYINGDCHSCLENLEKWGVFYSEILDKELVQIIFFLHSYDIEYLMESHPVFSSQDFTTIEDKNNSFFTINNLSGNRMFHTFLVNDGNEIILVGNPTFNFNLSRLYLEVINSGMDIPLK